MIFCSFAIAASLAVTQSSAVEVNTAPPTLQAQSLIASEAQFADLVDRARGLKSIVDGWISSGEAANSHFHHQPAFSQFKTEAAELSRLNLQGHLVLKERGTDGDLTCILRGISEDMPKKVEAVELADGETARKVALEELAYLLNDNVEVITAPPVAP